MTSTSQPIDAERFASALESLPIDALHSKVAELNNSLIHLRSSNQQMLPFAEEGDQDCKDAMLENLGVIGRTNEKIGLIRTEVERRGLRWSEGEVEDAQARESGTDMVNGDGELVNGRASIAHGASAQGPAQSGRLTDEELRRQMEQQMQDEEDGVHL